MDLTLGFSLFFHFFSLCFVYFYFGFVLWDNVESVHPIVQNLSLSLVRSSLKVSLLPVLKEFKCLSTFFESHLVRHFYVMFLLGVCCGVV